VLTRTPCRPLILLQCKGGRVLLRNNPYRRRGGILLSRAGDLERTSLLSRSDAQGAGRSSELDLR
jgi:hypothetical protein